MEEVERCGAEQRVIELAHRPARASQCLPQCAVDRKPDEIGRARRRSAGPVPFGQRLPIAAELWQAFLTPRTHQHARQREDYRLRRPLAPPFAPLTRFLW